MNSFSFLCRKCVIAVMTCAALLMGGSAFAQTVTGSGKVVDSKGEPIIGASVIEKGSTTNGVITDIDGAFSIKVPSGKQIEVSCIGYETVVVAAAPNLTIVLKDDALVLEEAVAVGYGTMKKKDVTGAMVSVTSEELTANPVMNAVEALQGKAAGVVVSSAGVRPGSVGSIAVRGANALTSANPLVVIDGVPTDLGLNAINTEDIERIDVLKDASATAIYAYCFAHGINEGWLNPLTYGPAAILAWNAVSTVIDEEGKVNGTCVGTGMAFDPAFYYYRPVSPYAAHAYGPAVFAGAEIIRLLDTKYPRLNDNAVQFYDEDYSSKGAIFSVN